MLKRVKHRTKAADINRPAQLLVDVSTSENNDTLPPTKAQISMLMIAMGRKGWKKGGKRRLQTMTAEERSDVARKAANARWSDKRLKA